jgi:hypothetical protein
VRNHIGDRLLPRGRGRLNQRHHSGDLRATRAWHPAAVTCAGRGGLHALHRAVLIADEFLTRVDDAGGSADYADGCHEQHITAPVVPSLSSRLSPRFLPPSRLVRRRWGSGKGSGRTFGGVEIE